MKIKKYLTFFIIAILLVSIHFAYEKHQRHERISELMDELFIDVENEITLE